MLFCVGLIFELLRIWSTKREREVAITNLTKRRQNFHRQFSLVLLWTGSALTLAAAIANTQTGRACQRISKGSLRIGQTSLAMHWTTWVLSFLVCAGSATLRRTTSGAAKQLSEVALAGSGVY